MEALRLYQQIAYVIMIIMHFRMLHPEHRDSTIVKHVLEVTTLIVLHVMILRRMWIRMGDEYVAIDTTLQTQIRYNAVYATKDAITVQAILALIVHLV